MLSLHHLNTIKFIYSRVRVLREHFCYIQEYLLVKCRKIYGGTKVTFQKLLFPRIELYQQNLFIFGQLYNIAAFITNGSRNDDTGSVKLKLSYGLGYGSGKHLLILILKLST